MEQSNQTGKSKRPLGDDSDPDTRSPKRPKVQSTTRPDSHGKDIENIVISSGSDKSDGKNEGKSVSTSAENQLRKRGREDDVAERTSKKRRISSTDSLSPSNTKNKDLGSQSGPLRSVGHGDSSKNSVDEFGEDPFTTAVVAKLLNEIPNLNAPRVSAAASKIASPQHTPQPEMVDPIISKFSSEYKKLVDNTAKEIESLGWGGKSEHFSSLFGNLTDSNISTFYRDLGNHSISGEHVDKQASLPIMSRSGSQSPYPSNSQRERYNKFMETYKGSAQLSYSQVDQLIANGEGSNPSSRRATQSPEPELGLDARSDRSRSHSSGRA